MIATTADTTAAAAAATTTTEYKRAAPVTTAVPAHTETSHQFVSYFSFRVSSLHFTH